MDILQSLFSPYGTGFFMAAFVVVVLTVLWIWKVAFSTFHLLLGLCTSVFGTLAVVAVIFVFVVPRTLRPGMLTPHNYLTSAGAMLIVGVSAFVAVLAGFVTAAVMLRTAFVHGGSEPWYIPRAMLTLSVGQAAYFFGQGCFALRSYYAMWSKQDMGVVEFSWSRPALFWFTLLLGSLVATLASFIITGLRLPDVRAKWSDRLDRALEGLAYTGWSNMPYSSPYLLNPPARWLKTQPLAEEPEEDPDRQNENRED